jgi:hypothetical protein
MYIPRRPPIGRLDFPSTSRLATTRCAEKGTLRGDMLDLGCVGDAELGATASFVEGPQLLAGRRGGRACPYSFALAWSRSLGGLPMTASLSGMLADRLHLHRSRSEWVLGCPRVTVRIPDRPPHRARGGHDPVSCRHGRAVRDRVWPQTRVEPAPSCMEAIEDQAGLFEEAQ